MRPLISYYGGKQRMASKIVPLIPPHTVYCEPFAGGAAVFYAKPRPTSQQSNAYAEILNDLNGDLICMYKEAQADANQFSSFLKATPFSEHWYQWARMVLDCKTKDAKSAAVAKYVAHQQGFAHKSHSGWRRACLGNSALAWRNATDGVLEASNRLRGVSLDNCDAVKFINHYDSPHTFFYVDPPYLGTHLGQMGQWGPNDLRRLVDCLNMSRGSFVISGYDLSASALRGAVSKEFSAHCSASGVGRTRISRNHGEPVDDEGKERTEVVWMRGPAAPVRKSLIPILQKQTCFTGPLLGPCPLPLAR